jgi:histidine triad (HIT) family protein
MSSIFSKIIAGEIPCYKIAENNDFIAFLDMFPIVKGHVLVVPKTQVNKIFDADTSLLAAWLPFAQPIAKAIEKAFDCKRCGISVIGLEVPHAHMHLVPIRTADDLNFTRPKLNLSETEMKEAQKLILNLLQP